MTVSEKITFDDVLEAMLNEEVAPTHEALLEWTARFPAFANDLSKYFAVWAVQSEEGDSFEIPAFEHFANRGVSQALNLLHAQRAANSALGVVRLSAMAKKHGLSDSDLATRVGVDEAIIMKLDRGRIAPASGIPRLLIERLAEAVVEQMSAVWSAVQLPAAVASRGALQKSKKRATFSVETFAQALDASSLPPERKAEWRRAISEGTGPP